jgi:hypothetical protein
MIPQRTLWYSTVNTSNFCVEVVQLSKRLAWLQRHCRWRTNKPRVPEYFCLFVRTKTWVYFRKIFDETVECTEHVLFRVRFYTFRFLLPVLWFPVFPFPPLYPPWPLWCALELDPSLGLVLCAPAPAAVSMTRRCGADRRSCFFSFVLI